MADKLARNPTNVRFESGALKRLKVVAKRHRLKPSQLIREAVEEKLPEWEARGVQFRASNDSAA
jgi:hypothetical protein